MIYRLPIRIGFNHCDPAGIVFYPRYFEMTNTVAENFFREVALAPYEAMMRIGTGVPMAALGATFHAPSRLGEVLEWRLDVSRLGRTSVGFHVEAHCGASHRLSADLTLVHVGDGGRPQPWPDGVRARIAEFMARE